MKQLISTMLGNVEVVEVSLNRATGYGQYRLSIEFIFEGSKQILNIHSTDSKLFDKISDLENNTERSEYLMTHSRYTIEAAIEDYINSL